MSIHYNILSLSVDQRKELFKEAKWECYLWSHDLLDCSVSFARQNVCTSTVRTNEKQFDEILEKFDDSCYSVFIDRQGRGTWNRPECWEIGFCTMTSGVDHYLFIHVEPQVARRLIEKYKLFICSEHIGV